MFIKFFVRSCDLIKVCMRPSSMLDFWFGMYNEISLPYLFKKTISSTILTTTKASRILEDWYLLFLQYLKTEAVTANISEAYYYITL